jgi:UDP-N-acetylglucosamine--N-acetylmuramyl-(pentapeptide) pyrophosphoryl-undecaprenol N-acetylglucosamine transferase
MAEAMAAADLIISRAGASTLSEIQAVGKPSILFPYPYHRDQHQRHNASVLVDGGAAVLIDDRMDAIANAAQLGPVLARLMGDASCRENMARAAWKMDCPRSADDIAARLLAATNSAKTSPCDLSDQSRSKTLSEPAV